MKILEELREFFKNILNWVYVFIGFSFSFFLFPLSDSLSVQVFRKIQLDLLPQGVQLIVTNPMSAFISQMLLAVLLAFVITFPFLLYKIIKYLAPALFKHERKLIFQSLLPSVLLFFAGCVFSYYFLIPSTLKILYQYALNIGATPFFSLEEFMSSVFNLMVISGFMFLLPIFMVLSSFLNIVKKDFWKNKLRYASLFFLIFTAIITPDGTGITMLILFFPLIGLYLVGCLLTQGFKKRNIKRDDE